MNIIKVDIQRLEKDNKSKDDQINQDKTRQRDLKYSNENIETLKKEVNKYKGNVSRIEKINIDIHLLISNRP